MVAKYRDALRVVRQHVSSKRSWVELMKLSEMDDSPEVAVDIHMDDPPAQISSIRTRIKSLVTGVWDTLKKLTEYMAPTVVKTPATPATTAILEPEVDPDELGLSVPQNALLTFSHDRRFDWVTFSRNLMIESLNATESGLQPLSTKVKDNQSAFNAWIWTWAYEDPDKVGDDHRFPDKCTVATFFTILLDGRIVECFSKTACPSRTIVLRQRQIRFNPIPDKVH